MKLFVWSKKITGTKNYLGVAAKVRNDLRIRFSGDSFHFPGTGDDNFYNVQDVHAEKGFYKAGGLAVVGGVVGVIAGPPGTWLGAALGAYIGNRAESEKIDAFNYSR